MKPNKATVEARVNEILRIILDGAQILFDVWEYVREQEKKQGSPWQLPEGHPPLSDSQLWRYVAKAERAIKEACKASRRKLTRRHLAQRRNLYAKAVAAGDLRAVLSVLRDLAELQGLYPPTKTEVNGNLGGVMSVEYLNDFYSAPVAAPALEDRTTAE